MKLKDPKVQAVCLHLKKVGERGLIFLVINHWTNEIRSAFP